MSTSNNSGRLKMENNNNTNVIPVPVEPYNREEFIRMLEEEGMIRIFPVSEINDQSILAAAYNVVKNLRTQREKLTVKTNNDTKELDNFYRACQKSNILVSRNNDNEIVLTTVLEKQKEEFR